MENNIEDLKNRVKFLELLLQVNSETLSKSIETNRILIEEIKKERKNSL